MSTGTTSEEVKFDTNGKPILPRVTPPPGGYQNPPPPGLEQDTPPPPKKPAKPPFLRQKNWVQSQTNPTVEPLYPEETAKFDPDSQFSTQKNEVVYSSARPYYEPGPYDINPNPKKTNDDQSLKCFDCSCGAIYLLLFGLGVGYGLGAMKPVPIISVKWVPFNSTNNTVDDSEGVRLVSPLGNSVAYRVGSGVYPLAVLGFNMLLSCFSFWFHYYMINNQEDPPTPEENKSWMTWIVKKYNQYSFFVSYFFTILVLSVLVGHITIIELVSQCSLAFGALAFYGVAFMLSRYKGRSSRAFLLIEKNEDPEKNVMIKKTEVIYLSDEFIFGVMCIGLLFETINWILLFVGLGDYNHFDYVAAIVAISFVYYMVRFLYEAYFRIHNPFCCSRGRRIIYKLDDFIYNAEKKYILKEEKKSRYFILKFLQLGYDCILFGLVWVASS